MPVSIIHSIDPVARFREIYAAFQPPPAWSTESAWLRFAAQAAVMRPGSPADTAHAIRATADQLSEHAGWFDALGSPLNLVIAALIVQTGDTAGAFAQEVPPARRKFHAAGLPRSGAHELKAIAILRVLNEAKPVDDRTVARMQAIYQEMKSHHWWLTGADDLPACALLTAAPGKPADIAGFADHVYGSLRKSGLSRGQHLQTAANLLPLTGVPATQAAVRYLELAETFRNRDAQLWSEDYDAVALLCLLEHDAARVVNRVLEIRSDLDALNPPVYGAVDFSVAVDLAFLDLVRFDPHMRSISEPLALEALRDTIRRQRAASTVLVQVSASPVGVSPLDWPPIA